MTMPPLDTERTLRGNLIGITGIPDMTKFTLD